MSIAEKLVGVAMQILYGPLRLRSFFQQLIQNLVVSVTVCTIFNESLKRAQYFTHYDNFCNYKKFDSFFFVFKFQLLSKMQDDECENKLVHSILYMDYKIYQLRSKDKNRIKYAIYLRTHTKSWFEIK